MDTTSRPTQRPSALLLVSFLLVGACAVQLLLGEDTPTRTALTALIFLASGVCVAGEGLGIAKVLPCAAAYAGGGLLLVLVLTYAGVGA